MKIITVTEDTPYLAGGRIAFLKLCRAVALLRHNVTIITCSGATEGVISVEPARIVRLRIWQTRFLGPAQFIVKLFIYLFKLSSDKPEAIIVNAGYAVFPAIFAAKLMNIKVVGMYHDALALTELFKYAVSPLRKFTAAIRWFLMYAPLRFIDGIVSVSPWTAERLKIMGVKAPIVFVGNVVEV